VGVVYCDDVVSLRDARRDRGWSQTTAVARLRELAEQGEVDVASAASLKTQLSRWENGTVPDEPYRTLLAELYERELGELGIDVTPHWERTHEIPDLLTEIRDELRTLNELLRERRDEPTAH
jgi:transcriptional regulator with XRE-family HTH domain